MLIGLAVLGALWFFPTVGAALIGFLLRKNTAVEAGPTGPLVGQASTASVAGGWGGLGGTAVLGLIVLFAFANVGKHAPLASGTVKFDRTKNGPDTASNEWEVVESANQMDNTPIVVLIKKGSAGSSLTIRCSKGKTDAYVDTNSILDDSSVRVRFDQSGPVRQIWGKSSDDKALFAPDAITFARQLTKARLFLLEFTAFREGTRTISFDVTNLASKLDKISDTCNWEVVDRSRAMAKAADAALRARLVQYVHPCDDQNIGKWCWSDPNDDLFDHDTGWSATKEGALQDAMRSARWGLAFKAK